MNATDKELEKYYEDMLAMFRTNGWKVLMEDLKVNGQGINNVEATKDDKDLYFRKGQLVVMANLLNLEAQIETAKQQQDEDDSEE